MPAPPGGNRMALWYCTSMSSSPAMTDARARFRTLVYVQAVPHADLSRLPDIPVLVARAFFAMASYGAAGITLFIDFIRIGREHGLFPICERRDGP